MRAALLLLVVSCFAQSVPLPSTFAASGAAYDRFAPPGTPYASGWASYGTEVNSGGLYSFSTATFTGNSSSVRTGFAKHIAQSGGLHLLALVDGGVQTSAAGNALGAISGGGIAAYDLGALAPKLQGKGWYLIAVARMLSVASAGSRSVYEFGLAFAR